MADNAIIKSLAEQQQKLNEETKGTKGKKKAKAEPMNKEQQEQEEEPKEKIPTSKPKGKSDKKKDQKAEADEEPSSEDEDDDDDQESGSFDESEEEAARPRIIAKAGDVESEKSKLGILKSIQKRVGPKSSATYVDDLEKAVKEAKITNDELAVFIDLFKTLPMSGDIQAVLDNAYKLSLEGQKARGVSEEKAQKSKPYLQLKENAYVFMAAVKRIHSKVENKNSLTWGTFARLKDIAKAVAALRVELEKPISNYNKFFYKKIIPSCSPFEWVYSMWTFRIGCLCKLVSMLKEGNKLNFVEKEPQGPGYVLRDPKEMSKVLEKTIVAENMAEAREIVTSDGFEEEAIIQVAYTWAMGCDVRQCMMAEDMRVSRGRDDHSDMNLRRVLGAMKFVINTVAGEIEYDNFSIDPKQKFCIDYYTCRSIMLRTKRNIDRELYGASTGPDTRALDMAPMDRFDDAEIKLAIGNVTPIGFKL